jgi:hypothetical protein
MPGCLPHLQTLTFARHFDGCKTSMMTAKISPRIEELQPEMPRAMCKGSCLLPNMVDNPTIGDDEHPYGGRAGLWLQSVTDQHAAMTEDSKRRAQQSRRFRKKTSRLPRHQGAESLDLYVGQTVTIE